jgi:hypothetical protein
LRELGAEEETLPHLMLKVYIDESGHDGRGWMFLAGYIGSEEQ